jgi:hypothetical protein
VIAAERTARLAGAQDVRSLCNAGGRGPLFPSSHAMKLDPGGPWSVYLAVRFCGYWTEGFETFQSNPSLSTFAVRAALDAAATAMCAGASGRRIWDTMKPHLAGFDAHPMLGTKLVRAHGLSLDTQPWITNDSGEQLPGEGTYVVAAGATDANGIQTIESVSIMLDGMRRTILYPRQPDFSAIESGFDATQMPEIGAIR